MLALVAKNAVRSALDLMFTEAANIVARPEQTSAGIHDEVAALVELRRFAQVRDAALAPRAWRAREMTEQGSPSEGKLGDVVVGTGDVRVAAEVHGLALFAFAQDTARATHIWGKDMFV